MNEQKDHLDIFESYPLDRSDQTRSLNQRTEPVVWRCAYLLLTFALGLLFIVLVDAGDVVSGAVKLIFAALLILTLKRWTGAMILALVQAVLFHLEQPFFAPLSTTTGVMWIGLTTGLLLTVSRYRTLQDIDKSSSLRAFAGLRTAYLTDRVAARKVQENLTLLRRRTVRTTIVVACCGLLALGLLNLLPFYGRSPDFSAVREFRLRPGGFRVIMSGLSLFVIFLPIWILVNEIVWRTQTARQASVYLRSVLLKWVHRDLRMVAKKRLKQRRRRLRAMKPVRAAESSDETNAGTL